MRVNASRLEKLYITVLMVIFGGIVLHAPLSVSLGTLLPDYALLIKSWKEILMVLLLPVVVVIISRRGLWHEFLKNWLLRLIVAYAILHLIIIPVLYRGAIATPAGLAIDLRYALFFVLVYIAIRILPQYRRRMILVSVVGATIVVTFAVLQLLLPKDALELIGYSKDTILPYLLVDQNTDFVRVNSTLRGPNPLGAYTAMTLGLIAAAIVRSRLRLSNKKTAIMTMMFIVCSLIALWISYSRSALVAGAITVGLIGVIALAHIMSRKHWIIGSAVLLALVGAAIVGRSNEIISNVLYHENLSDGMVANSNDQHVESLVRGTDLFIRQPLGAGVGSTGSASLHNDIPVIIENQYLFVAHETGWIGLGFFLIIFGYILVQLWRRREDWLSLGVFASGIGLGLIGLLQPVWVDDTVSIVWWGLAAIALAGKGIYERKKTK